MTVNNIPLKLNISIIVCYCYSINSWSIISHKGTSQGILILTKRGDI